jgi:formylglycine-generating enzyme
MGTRFRAIVLLLTVLSSGRIGAAGPSSRPSEAGLPRDLVQRVPGTKHQVELVLVPGGTFTMGSPEAEANRRPDEGTQFRVEVEPFYTARFEVSWPLYAEFLNSYHRVIVLPDKDRQAIPANRLADAVTYPTPLYEIEAGPILDRMGRGAGMPAVMMSHFAAKQFTKWLSKKTGRFYRLPTEAEWEYAARAGTTTAFSFGDDLKRLDQHGWYFDNSPTDESPDGTYRSSGSKKPNVWGLYDMHGNVAEWCVDAYDAKWYEQFKGKTVSWRDAVNWPTKRYPIVFRGGGWDAEPADCRSAARRYSTAKCNIVDPCIPRTPHYEGNLLNVGIRLVAPVRAPDDPAERARYWDAHDAETVETLKRDREAHEMIDSPPPIPTAP